MTKQLTKEQLAVLVQYERLFRQAIDARYCSYPGTEGVNKMLEIWNDVTGEGRRMRPGCSTCIFHLVQDLGTLYFAQKPIIEAKKAPAQEKPQPKPKTTAKPKETGKAAKK